VGSRVTACGRKPSRPHPQVTPRRPELRHVGPTPTGVAYRPGMRGGLGKTLLITFLLLTIVPLSFLAFLTYNQIQRDTGQKLIASLENVVALKEAHLIDWLRNYERELTWLAGVLNAAEARGYAGEADDGSQAESYSSLLAELQAIDPTLDALVLMDLDSGQVLASTDPAWADARLLQSLLAEADGRRPDEDPDLILGSRPGSAGSYGLVVALPTAEGGERLLSGQDGWTEPGSAQERPVLAVKYAWENADASGRPRIQTESGRSGSRLLIGVLNWDSLRQLLSNSVALYLVTRDGRILSSEGLTASEDALARDHPARNVLEGEAHSPDDGAGLSLLQSGTYTGLEGNPVFGAYRWNPELQLGIVAEQSQREALATGNTVTAVMVGTTLAVALVTSILAAIITRRVTRPIVQLTETAACMARGDLNQRVLIKRGDEIGVLSRAFNRMAAELGVLYENLEARVTERTRQLAERTEQLEAANKEIRGYLMQLATSAEVARVAVSIRDPDELLTTVVGLIGRSFELDDVSVYLLDEARTSPGEARGYLGSPGGRRGVPAWSASGVSGDGTPVDQEQGGPEHSAGRANASAEKVQAGQWPVGTPVRWMVWRSEGNSDSAVPADLPGVPADLVPRLVDLVAADGCRRVVQAGTLKDGREVSGLSTSSVGHTDAGGFATSSVYPPTEARDVPSGADERHAFADGHGPAGVTGVPTGAVCELAVPLRIQQRVLGVLDLRSDRPDAFGEDEQLLYQSLADQIGIAIENARVYAVERQTVARLRELDRIQSEFLTNMSHALRTPLNSIIGFSRVLLKELDGPLNETQRTDLLDIYDSGRQLLGLINDMLELSQLQLGVAPFTPGEVNLAEIIEGVMATTRALARGKPVRLYEEVPKDLPVLYTDGQWVRRVVLALLSSAVKFTARGSIHLRVSTEDGHVTISVQDTRTDKAVYPTGDVRRMGFPREERERVFSNKEESSYEAGGYAGEVGAYADGADGPTESGFGLAVSRQVVERLGGQIWMESEEGIGSTFTFTLPIKPQSPDTLTASEGDGDAV
jgi:signal transduction histidine kinase